MKSQRAFSILLFLSLVLFASGCDRIVTNSSENDELIASVASLPGRPPFKDQLVYSIIAKCASCHTHQAWYGYGETDYATAGLIEINGDYANSKMYYRLSTATDGPGPKNMPQGGGAAFSEEEVELMKTWISTY